MDSEATELLAELMPDEADVESEVNELFVLLRPVESEPMPVEVDVDNEATVLLVVDSPVDSELTPLCAVLMPEEADV
ncbi:hypothetical protein, partial [Burkholderia pseudomallei]